MKKIFQLTSLLAMALVLFSCTKKELSTDQYDSAVVALKAYGPQPVVRGGVLRFVGSNLDKVATVTLPGVSPITPEVVTSGTHSEIRVTVPKDGPEVGYPVLNLSDGTTITGKTQLTYDEPIIIDEVTPLSVYPGDNITLTGDYLNLLHEVIFANEVKVSEDDFVEHTRYKIVVTVPEEAQTGMLAVGTVDESKLEDVDDALASLNMMELEEITVGTATGTFPEAPIKAGSQVVIKGSHLLLVEDIEIEDYTVGDFEATDTQITFELSDAAPDGEVCLVMASGLAVPIGTLTTVAPSELAVNPNPVKAGETLKVTGKDLDLVDNIAVGGVGLSDYNCNEDGTEISFPVPETSVDGDIVLIMVNRKQVTVPFTLVVPTITAVDPEEITAGDSFTVTGTDLDLVKSVTIGDVACEFTADSATQLTVTSAATAKTGKVNLILNNGKSVSSETEIVVKAAGKVQVNVLPSSASVGDEITMEGAGFFAIEAIYFGETKITAYSKRTDIEMTFLIPTDLEAGTYAPKFVLTTGEEENCPMSIEIKGAITTVTILDEEHDLGLTWSAGFSIGADKFAKVPYGATLHVEYETPDCAEEWYQIQLCENVEGWPKLEIMGGKDVLQFDKGTSSFTQVISDNDLRTLAKSGMGIGGHALVVKKIYFTYENSSSDPIFVTDIVLIDWDDHGGHNGGWDMPWDENAAGGVLRNKAEGNQYMYYGNDLTEWKWLAACNHYDKYTVNPPALGETDMTKYNIKLDVLIVDGETSLNPLDCAFKVIVGDQWASDAGVCSGVIPATTNGKWITITVDPAKCQLPDTIDTSKGSNGLYGTCFKGLCFDNYRLSLK